MEKLEIILSVAVTGLSLIATAVTFIAKFLKSAKAKRVAEQMIEITNILIPIIEQAENFTGYSGREKKEYVMTRANQFAIDNKIKFPEEIISAQIEELVTLSKKVNKREKDVIRNNSFPITLNNNR